MKPHLLILPNLQSLNNAYSVLHRYQLLDIERHITKLNLTNMYTHVHPCTLMHVHHVYSCTLVYTHVHLCTLFTLLYTNVHPCTLMYTHVHSCTPMYTHVHSCTPMYTTHVHSCTPMHTHETFMYNPVNVYSVHVILTDTACIYQAMKCTPCTLVYSTTILDLWSYIMPLM